MEQLAAIMSQGIVTNVIVVQGPSPAWVLIPLGQPVGIGWTYDGLSFAPPVKPLETVRAERLAYIEQEYETREHADILYMGAMFQADDCSQALISKVLTALNGAIPADFGWWDVANTRVLMTNAQLQGLAQVIFARNQPLYINKQARKAAIRAATTVAQIEAVVW